MDHDRVRLLLNGYVDGELDLVNSLEIEEHLRGCAACTRQYQGLVALHKAAGNSALRYAAPAGLEKRVRSSLRKAGPESSAWWQTLPWRWIAPVAGLVAILLLAAIFLRDRFVPPPQTVLANEVQSAHVRSLMASHLADVTSSDQHTVKPWFSGKLDFSPPVMDFAPEGFPLIGGRLDYLDGHSAAALVYQRNKHVINLFIWPTTDPATEPTFLSKDGYNQYHWNESGMTYWAVSDLNAGELQGFVELARKNFK